MGNGREPGGPLLEARNWWMFESILCQVPDHDPELVAVEIAREGREAGWQLFTPGDENVVLARSRALILDPLLGC